MTKILSVLSVPFLLSSNTFAHEKWFTETSGYGLRWDLYFRPVPLIFTGVILFVTAAAWFFWKSRGSRGFVPGPAELGALPERRAAFYGLVPAILGIHLAVPMLVGAVQGHLFSPNIGLRAPWLYFVGLALTGLALSFFYGGLTRLSAIALTILWIVGLIFFGVEATFDNFFYLGFAGFFFLAGRGPISVDRLLIPRLNLRLSK